MASAFVSPRTRLWGKRLFFTDKDTSPKAQCPSDAGSTGAAGANFILGRRSPTETTPRSGRREGSGSGPSGCPGSSSVPPLPPLPGPGSGAKVSPCRRPSGDSAVKAVGMSCAFCAPQSPLAVDGQVLAAGVRKLLLDMVRDALQASPMDPAMFFLEWLLARAKGHVPEHILQQLVVWHSETNSSVFEMEGAMQSPATSASPAALPSDATSPAAAPSDATSVSAAALPSEATTEPTDAMTMRRSRSILKTSSTVDTATDERPGSPETPRRVSRGSRSSRVAFAGLSDEVRDDDTLARTELSVTSLNSTGSMGTSHSGGRPSVIDYKVLDGVREAPLFKNLADEEFALVKKAFELRTFEPDAEIVQWGQRGGDFHVIQSGSACFSVPQLAYSLEAPGDFFGDHLLTKRHIVSEHRIVAGSSGPLVTLCLPHKKFEELEVHRRILQRQKKHRRTSKVLGRGELAATARGDDDCLSPPTSPMPSRGIGKCVLPDDCEPARAKTAHDLKLIIDGIRENVHLTEVLQPTDQQIQVIAQRMVWMPVDPDNFVYHEGDFSTSFFVIHDGLFEVLERGRVIQKLSVGQSFGELGLLYGSKSKQSVRVARGGGVWRLSRELFAEVLLKKKSPARLREYAELLQSSEAFGLLTKHQLTVLAEALEENFCDHGESLVKLGEPVLQLFVVFDGVLRLEQDGEVPGTLRHGDMFGLEQMAIQDSDKPQPYSLIVSSETATVLTVQRDTLELLAEMSISDMLENKDDADMQGFGSDGSSDGGLASPSGAAVGRCKSLNPFRSARYKSLVLGTTVPRERLRRIAVLGAGSFGHVSLEVDEVTGKHYAMKAMSKGMCVEKGLEAVTIREKQIHMMLNSPFIVRLYCTYKDAQFLYFLLQPATGGDLFEVCNDNPSFFGSLVHAQFYTAGLCLGLEHMHDKKIIYRDIKLENVLLEASGYPLIADMGLAKIVVGKTYTVCGTADYMAPETLRRTGHDRAVDWWAVGVFMFVMMSGRSPFDASEAAQIYRNIVKGMKKEHYPESFDKPLREAIGGLCRKKPEERLPMGPKGLAHLKESTWFNNFDWQAMASRMLDPPWDPPAKTADEYAAHKVDPPPVSQYVDDGSNWDAEF